MRARRDRRRRGQRERTRGRKRKRKRREEERTSVRNDRTKGKNVAKRVLTFPAEMASSDLINSKLILVAHATSGGEGILDKRKVKSKEEGRSRSSHKFADRDVGHHRERVHGRGKGGGNSVVNFSPAESESFVNINIIDNNPVDGTTSHLGKGDEGTVWQVATSPEVDGRSISMLMDEAAVDDDRGNKVVVVKIGGNERGA